MPRLVWEQADLTGRRGPHPKFEYRASHFPPFGQRLQEFPFAFASVRGSHKRRVRRIPAAFGWRRRPLRLRLWANQGVRTESLELAPATAVDQLISGPSGGETLQVIQA